MCLSGTCATVSVFSETFATIDGINDSNNDTNATAPVVSSVIDRGDEVVATVNSPGIITSGEDFQLTAGSADIRTSRDRPPPGGNRSVDGSFARYTIDIILQAGETLDYNVNFGYNVNASQGGGDPTISWFFRNETTNTDFFSGVVSTSSTDTVSESGTYTAGSTPETLSFQVSANLTDTRLPPNSSGTAEFNSLAFDADSDLTPGFVPEPSTAILGLFGLSALLARRKRSA